MSKIPKKVMIAKVVLIGSPDKLPDFGLGTGVISQTEFVWKDNHKRGFDSPIFSVALFREEDDLIRKSVRVEWSEKRSKKKGGAK